MPPAIRMLVAALVLWQAAAGAQAAGGAAAPGRPGEVLRAVLFEVPPYALRGPQGQAVGLYADWLRAMGDRHGFDVRIDLVPFARVPATLGAGQADIGLGFRTPALESAAVALGTAGHDELIVVPRKGLRWTEPQQFAGQQIGRARGGCADLSARRDLEIRWTDLERFDSGLRMLRLDRLDGLCLTRTALAYAAGLASMSAADWGPPLVIVRNPIHLWVRRDLPDAWRERLATALRQTPRLQP